MRGDVWGEGVGVPVGRGCVWTGGEGVWVFVRVWRWGVCVGVCVCVYLWGQGVCVPLGTGCVWSQGSMDAETMQSDGEAGQEDKHTQTKPAKKTHHKHTLGLHTHSSYTHTHTDIHTHMLV